MWRWLKNCFRKKPDLDNPALDVAMRDGKQPMRDLLTNKDNITHKKSQTQSSKNTELSIDKDGNEFGHNPYDKF